MVIYPLMNSKQEHFASASAVHVRRFGEDVANRPAFVPSSPSDTSKPRKTPTPTPVFASASTPRSHSAPPPLKRQMAIPFPTISEEGEGVGGGESYEHDPLAEETRAGEWAEEVKRRQGCIKELRERKVRLEMGRSERGGWNGWERVRKGRAGSSGGSSYTTYTSPTPAPAPAKILSSTDVEFISTLHSSVVWRLWHVDLTPTDFANERALATRLHLVLMRHGKRDIPVPPIVALSKGHHHNHLRHGTGGGMGGGQGKGKEVQSLDQLVAKSLLRKGKSGRRSGKGREAKLDISVKREVQRSPLGRVSPVSW